MIEEFLAIGIIGVGLSIIIEWIQQKFGTDSKETKLLSIVLSIGIGSVYIFFKDTVWWTTILGILGSASTMYALVFNNSKKSK